MTQKNRSPLVWAQTAYSASIFLKDSREHLPHMPDKEMLYIKSFLSVCETNELDNQFSLLLLCSISMEETK